ncbi:DUF3040 domain-containing protein [Arthrobacter sp. 4R501]|uniref:DUF3040 domain-containing protein n=1 Tax=Arthrobacter sp. 4R501 TaxID=2058886 RepID=UPI000CE535D6|nr:DUF3040 domain-containing protein [Arthrobacter sp. 4R501]
MVALTDHEKRALEEIAVNLERDDPRLASKLGSGAQQPAASQHTVAGIFAAIVGCLVLLVAIAVQAMLLGAIGFIIMGAGAYAATLRLGRLRLRRPGPSSSPSAGQPEHG